MRAGCFTFRKSKFSTGRHRPFRLLGPLVLAAGMAFICSLSPVEAAIILVPGDYPTIQAVILLFSLVYVLINLAVDLIYRVFDPRIRY